MNSNENLKPIVAAVDGSDSARRAAGWAAQEALRRGRPLRIVSVYEWPPLYGAYLVDPASLADAVRNNADDAVRDVAAIAANAVPGVPVESATMSGQIVPTLREVSREASLLVLGSRGLGGFTGLLAGSAAVALAAHGHCPVAVIRGENTDPNAPVVVGVDGSPASEAAVALAFEEAAERGCGLVGVHAWTDMVFPLTPNTAYYPKFNWAELTEQARKLLAGRLAGGQEKYPQVAVRQVVEHDRPAHALLIAAKEAQLVVAGSRGRGGFAGLVLGSVSQALIHHAPCPVLIARPDPH